MRVNIYKARCEVCGEDGMTTPSGNYAQWRGGFMHHTDPSVCAYNLRRQRRGREVVASVPSRSSR